MPVSVVLVCLSVKSNPQATQSVQLKQGEHGTENRQLFFATYILVPLSGRVNGSIFFQNVHGKNMVQSRLARSADKLGHLSHILTQIHGFYLSTAEQQCLF